MFKIHNLNLHKHNVLAETQKRIQIKTFPGEEPSVDRNGKCVTLVYITAQRAVVDPFFEHRFIVHSALVGLQLIQILVKVRPIALRRTDISKNRALNY